MTHYKSGDKVEYRPIGGASDNVAHSTGEIVDVVEEENGEKKYAIKNDNTGKTANYMEMNIVKKI
ncbi:hypothetical protein JAAARDRAFT_58628 [Jaapia argillacea MUCL 33604]|uniref:Hypervirulence associated protein TUDOR domain-containing protein n=1 Tax=Jaapia argillacea MUCL 33604 TaxID=933084 RepID=A0A067PQS0_9AGAM|nr:hypothetical protein JAAARDRAFT_58628 [Jaapia argillacea MUCL 33604]